MKNDLLLAVNQLAGERNLPPLTVVAAIEEALAAAYKKDAPVDCDVQVNINPNSGTVEVNTVIYVIGDHETPESDGQVTLSEARKSYPTTEVGDIIKTGSLEYSHGRIVAQNTKQIILQRLREAEREIAFEKFEEKQGSMSLGTVYRSERNSVLIDLDHNIAIMPAEEQSPTERYRNGQQLQVLVVKVERTIRGPEITVSRSSPELLERLFEKEIPEVSSGAIDIKAIAREAGSRSKVAVQSNSKDVDAVGACVGLRGIRIHSIVNEVMGEKVDVVEWNNNPEELIKNALNPASVERVVADYDRRSADVYVSPGNLSLAIGKDGQNVRLVGRLTGWTINIESVEDAAPVTSAEPVTEKAETEKLATQPAAKSKATNIKKLEEELAELEQQEQQVKLEQETTEEQHAEETAEKATGEDEVWSLESDEVEAETGGELRFAEDLSELKRKGPVASKARAKRKTRSFSGRRR